MEFQDSFDENITLRIEHDPITNSIHILLKEADVPDMKMSFVAQGETYKDIVRQMNTLTWLVV
jgi:hypothetical protein